MPRVEPAPEPLVLRVPLPPFRLEAGAALLAPHTTLSFWGSVEEHATLARGEPLEDDPARPWVCVLPTLTSARDPRDAFPALFGRGKPLRPWAQRIVAPTLLGSEHDPSGPVSPSFPSRRDDRRFGPPPRDGRGMPTRDEAILPATVTTWDEARALRFAVAALGATRIDLLFGASIGGMIGLAYAALAGTTLVRGCLVACPFATSAHTIAHDHLVREVLLADPDYPHGTATRGLARQVALFGYRGRAALEARNGRETAGPRHDAKVGWSSRTPYRVETYFRHLGEGAQRDPRATIALLGAMDHHDLARTPPFAPPGPPMLDRIAATMTCVAVSSDAFVTPEEVRALAERLGQRGIYREIESDFGHDGFLVENVRVARIVHEALTRGR